MNCSDIFRTEDVGQKCGDGREASAIHGEDGEHRDLEEYPLATRTETGHEQKQDELKREEDEICIAAAEKIGCGGPQEAAARIEHTDKGNDSSRLFGRVA